MTALVFAVILVDVAPLTPKGKLTAILGRLCGMQSDGTLENKEESGHSTRWGGAANYINATVGAGIIGLPYALHNIGFYAGLFFLCLSPYFICTGSHYLGTCGDKLQCFNYEALMRRTFGRKGYYAFSLFCFLNAVGACTAYIITMTDTITEVAEAVEGHGAFLASRTNTILVMGISIMCKLVNFLLSCVLQIAVLQHGGLNADALITIII